MGIVWVWLMEPVKAKCQPGAEYEGKPPQCIATKSDREGLPEPVKVDDGEYQMVYSKNLRCLENPVQVWHGWTYGVGAENMCMVECLVLKDECRVATTIFEKDSVSCMLFNRIRGCEKKGNWAFDIENSNSYSYIRKPYRAPKVKPTEALEPEKESAKAPLQPVKVNNGDYQMVYHGHLHCLEDPVQEWHGWKFGNGAQEMCMDECLVLKDECRLASTVIEGDSMACLLFKNSSKCEKKAAKGVTSFTYARKPYKGGAEEDDQESTEEAADEQPAGDTTSTATVEEAQPTRSSVPEVEVVAEAP